MNSNFKCNVEEIDSTINELVAEHFEGKHSELLRQMFTAVAKFGLESSDRGDMKLINDSIKELRYAFSQFSEYRNVLKIALFGSARTPKDTPQYKIAEEVAKKISQKGFMVITGAGGGIMEAGNKGAGAENSFGVNIRLPFEQFSNEYLKQERVINFKYFFTRKLIFLKESDATVLCPGGLGTLDEGLEALTLVQTGKSKPRPIILLAPEGDDYWDMFSEFMTKQLLRDGYISEQDLSLFQIFTSADKAVEEIVKFYSVYHSIRYIKSNTIIRLRKPPTDQFLKDANKEFSDLLESGSITSTLPMEIEVNQEEHLALSRLKMLFNKRKFGRLIQFIHFINAEL